MQRYFASIIGNNAVLKEEDTYHLSKVMRARVGDEVEIVCDGKTFLCRVSNNSPLQLELVKEIKEKRELNNNIILICALLKGDKLDYVIQKATELGVSEIVLLNSERVIVKVKEYASNKKIERYNRIVKEASEQSKRTKMPLLYRLISMDELKKVEADVKIIAYESEAGTTKSFWNEIKKIDKDQKVAIIIGPEGGFSEYEVKLAKQEGYIPVSLGKRILRAETASIYALSVIGSYLERK